MLCLQLLDLRQCMTYIYIWPTLSHGLTKLSFICTDVQISSADCVHWQWWEQRKLYWAGAVLVTWHFFVSRMDAEQIIVH